VHSCGCSPWLWCHRSPEKGQNLAVLLRLAVLNTELGRIVLWGNKKSLECSEDLHREVVCFSSECGPRCPSSTCAPECRFWTLRPKQGINILLRVLTMTVSAQRVAWGLSDSCRWLYFCDPEPAGTRESRPSRSSVLGAGDTGTSSAPLFSDEAIRARSSPL